MVSINKYILLLLNTFACTTSTVLIKLSVNYKYIGYNPGYNKHMGYNEAKPRDRLQRIFIMKRTSGTTDNDIALGKLTTQAT